MSQNTLVFTCILCPGDEPITFDEEVKLQCHYLFIHGKYMQPCGTGIAAQQGIRHDKIRKQYKELNKKLQQKKFYIKYSFKDTIFTSRRSGFGQRYKMKLLDKWIKYTADGQGWLNGRESETPLLMYDEHYPRLKKQLLELQSIGQQINRIKTACKEEGILLE